MKSETKAFLESVRAAEDPTPEDEKRVLAAVQAAAATGMSAAAGWQVSKWSHWFLSGASAAKFAAIAICAAAVAGDARTGDFTGWLAPPGPAERALVAPAASVPAAEAVSSRGTPSPLRSRQALDTAAEPSAASSVTAEAGQVPVDPPRSTPLAAASPPQRRRAMPSLSSELALLAEVQRALQRGNAELALRLLDGHVTRDRQLAAERAAARIRALCAAGRTAEARAAATEFAHRHPRSVQSEAVARSCGASLDEHSAE